MKNIYLFLLLVVLSKANIANNLLVQNVTTTGNDATNKTIQVQFDLSWDNSWRDDINYDAAWIFMKFKDGSGNWQHAMLNTTGFANGTGTANTVKVTADNIGCWVHRSANGSGTFNSTGMQLQWNYGLSGLTSVTGLEIRVFAIEMVYVPEGEFNCAKVFINNSGIPCDRPSCLQPSPQRIFCGPANIFPVINNRLSPTLNYNNGSSISLRVKGDAGIDTDNNGTIDNSIYPTGYRAFYCFKYELTEQQYVDFLNTLTSTQKTTLGVAGTGLTLSNGQYFSSTPNKACGNSTETRLLAYADWSGIRPMTFLEFQKASYGPLQPVYSGYYCSSGGALGSASVYYPVSNSNSVNGGDLVNVGYLSNSSTNRAQSGASYYGIFELTGNAHEPSIKLSNFNFSPSNGDGLLSLSGNSDVSAWPSGSVDFVDEIGNNNLPNYYGCSNWFSVLKYGFRYVRSAE